MSSVQTRYDIKLDFQNVNQRRVSTSFDDKNGIYDFSFRDIWECSSFIL